MDTAKPHFTSSYFSQSPGEFTGEKSVMRTLAFWLSLIVIFKIPSQNVIYTELGPTVSRGLGLLGMAFWAATVVVTGKFRKPRLVHLAIYLFFLWNVLSIFWSVDIAETVKSIPTYFQMIVLFMMLWDLYTTPAALKAGLQAYVLGAYVSIGSTIADYLAGIPASHWTGSFSFRYSATGTHPDVFALRLALGIPVAWHLAISESNSKMTQVLRLVNYAYIPAAIVAILLTGTRGASLASLPAFFFILASMRRLSLFHRILIFATLTCALFALFPLIPQYSLQRMVDAGTSIATGDLTGRMEIWREGIAVFVQHPLLGIGNNAFITAIATINPYRGAHNTFLGLLVQVGIIGFALFAIILAMTIRYAWHQPKWDSRFWLTLLMVWIIGNVSLSFQSEKSTWLILALVAASASLPMQRDESRLRSGFPVESIGSPNSSVVRRDGPGRAQGFREPGRSRPGLAEAKVEERRF
jgi:O-antigen ligase